MPFNHIILTVVMIVLWGLNFICIKIALQEIPPFLLVFLRFFFSAFPFVFFFEKPKGRRVDLVLYGVFTFAFQYIFLFYAMKIGAPPGISSLLIQTQALFTLILASTFLREKISFQKWLGVFIAFIGIIECGFFLKGELNFNHLFFILFASFSWGAGNLFSKRLKAKHPLGLVVWGSLCALPFVLIASLLNDGPEAMLHLFTEVHLKTIFAVSYIVYISTLVCFSIWGFLLSKYKSADIAPLTLFVPIVGFLSSYFVFEEQFTVPKCVASLFIFIGLWLSVKKNKT